jgi:hypothetical protein
MKNETNFNLSQHFSVLFCCFMEILWKPRSTETSPNPGATQQWHRQMSAATTEHNAIVYICVIGSKIVSMRQTGGRPAYRLQ